jgi:hypothetical protein
VDFSGLEKSFVSRRPNEGVGSYAYAMMCRFFCGVLQNHPALTDYTHYMRLDDDAYLVREVSPGMIAQIQECDYGYNGKSEEDHPSLRAWALKFMAENGLKPVDGYTRLVPYKNFHTASLALWRHPVIRRFLAGVEAEEGFMKQGWTDAAVHAVIAFCLAPQLGLRVITHKLPYRHNQHCCHEGSHNQYCQDGEGKKVSWGPPVCS